jgi:hypothetical protein
MAKLTVLLTAMSFRAPGRTQGSAEPTPIVRSVRGILKSGDTADFKEHLVSKYR